MGKICCILASMCAGMVISVLVPGCGGARDRAQPVVSDAGKQFLLSREPPGAMEVIKARETLEQSGESRELVLIGRVDGLGQPTWDPSRAAFMLADLSLQKDESDHDGAPKHDADSCPFCKAKKKKELTGLALVEVVGSSGEVPRVSAQELLGLSEGQTVVLQGEVTLDKLGTLVVRTGNIFIRRPTEQ